MAETIDLTVPTLHTNGSGWDNLSEQYRAAMRAICEAQECLPRPHARDYYVQDDDAFERARAQFNAQLKKLEEVEGELKLIFRKIMKQRRY